MNIIPPRGRYVIIVCASFLVGACTINTKPQSADSVEQALAQQYPGININGQLSQSELIENDVHTFNPSAQYRPLDKSLDLPQAIEWMLQYSPEVRIKLAQLGVADAQRLQADLIKNPGIRIGLLKPEDGGRWKLETGLTQPLLAFFTRPLRRQLAEDALLASQLQLQRQLQELIAELSNRFYSAVAAQQHLQIQQQMYQAVRARQQLALSLYWAGNMSENNFLYYDNELRRTQLKTQRRQQIAQEKQLTLLNFIGLTSSQEMNLATQLPVLPQESFEASALFEQAKKQRLDIKIIEQQLSLLQKRNRLIDSEYGWRDISFGINAEREFDGTKNIGPEVELSLPLFNQGQDKLAKNNAHIAQQHAYLQKALLNADSQIALSINAMNAARARAKNIEGALATAKKRVDLSGREVNFMLGSPFDLLQVKQQEFQFAHDYVNELQQYWLARTQLELAIGHTLPIVDPINTRAHKEHQHD
jgi:outer membrane protein, heavy metal efflux system